MKQIKEQIKIINYSNDLIFRLVEDIMELIGSKDRAPKIKIKSKLKEITLLTENIDHHLNDVMHPSILDSIAHLDTGVRAYDALVLSYSKHKLIHLEEFLQRIERMATHGVD